MGLAAKQPKVNIPVMLSRAFFGNRPEEAKSRFVIVVGTAFLAFVYAGSIIASVEIRSASLSNAERVLGTLDTLLVEETSRTVQGVQLVVEGVVERIVEDTMASDETFRVVATRAGMQQMLSDRAQAIPQLMAVAVLDYSGRLIGLSGRREIPDRDYSSDPLFEYLAKTPGNNYVLGATMLSSTETKMLPLARRVNGPDGRMIGIVVGLVRLEYFRDLYASLDIGEAGAISLWRTDGTLLAHHPYEDGTGLDFPRAFFEDLEDGAEPVPFRTGAGSDVRLVAAKKASGYPIVVTASFLQSSVLSTWWTATMYLALGCLVATLGGGFLVRGLVREFDSLELARKAMQDRAEAIAGRMEAEEQLRQAQKLEAVGQLTAGIAHDFNNLLTVVIGNLDLVGRRVAKDGNESAGRAVQSAMEGARKAAQLTHRLLAFARKQPLSPARIDISTLVRSVADMLKRTLGENVTIVVEDDKDLWAVHADANQLENVLVNLAINSRDAMQAGGTIRVTMKNLSISDNGLAEALSGDFVSICVSDDGEGMAPDILQRAVEPFFSTKGIGKGSGLGLSQVYGFAKQSGGDITMDSAVGEGTSVTIYLPRSIAEPVQAETKQAVVPGDGKTVLFVDDNPEIRTFGAMSLRDIGYVVIEASNAAEALRAIETTKVDAVVTDVGLPVVDGLELARRVLTVKPRMPIMFITGYGDDTAITEEFGKGHVMFKPFTYAAVAARVSKMTASPST